MIFEQHYDKSNKVACAPSQDSDLPRHLPRLIIVFAVCMKKAWVLSYPLSAQRRLIRLGRCPGWSECLLGARHLLVLSWCGSNKRLFSKVLHKNICGLRKRSAPAMNCWEINHGFEVSCTADNITSVKHECYIYLQLTDKPWFITTQFTHS